MFPHHLQNKVFEAQKFLLLNYVGERCVRPRKYKLWRAMMTEELMILKSTPVSVSSIE